jgi:SsrA-binding protein
VKITNKTANFNYEIYDTLEVGVVLSGAEVKSLFLGQASLDEAYVKVVGNELFLLNAHIHPYKFADTTKIDPKRSRKILLHKRELFSLQSKMQQKNLTIVPISWYNLGNKIKLQIALVRGKKKWEKRDSIKKKDMDRDLEIALKK